MIIFYYNGYIYDIFLLYGFIPIIKAFPSKETPYSMRFPTTDEENLSEVFK